MALTPRGNNVPVTMYTLQRWERIAMTPPAVADVRQPRLMRAEMNLVNTDGLVLIGPGSEWFWSAAQFLVVIVSVAGLYRQLRQVNAANAVQRMESLQGLWNSEALIQARLRVAIWRKHRTTDAPGYADQAALSSVCGFFENLSDLEVDRYITWKEIENTWGQALVVWWALLAPTIRPCVSNRPRPCTAGSRASPGEQNG